MQCISSCYKMLPVCLSYRLGSSCQECGLVDQSDQPLYPLGLSSRGDEPGLVTPADLFPTLAQGQDVCLRLMNELEPTGIITWYFHYSGVHSPGPPLDPATHKVSLVNNVSFWDQMLC
jgi:hypothetical protein